MSGYESQNTLAVNNIGASSGTYQKIDLGIKPTDEEKRNLVSDTFGYKILLMPFGQESV